MKKATLETKAMRDGPLSLYPYSVEEIVGVMLKTPPIKDKELVRWVRQRKMPLVDGEKLYALIHRLIPQSIPEDVREEMVSEITLAILSGDYSFRDLSTIRYSDFRARVYKLLPDRFKHISIDAPLNEEGLTLADVLAAPEQEKVRE